MVATCWADFSELEDHELDPDPEDLPLRHCWDALGLLGSPLRHESQFEIAKMPRADAPMAPMAILAERLRLGVGAVGEGEAGATAALPKARGFTPSNRAVASRLGASLLMALHCL